MKIINSSSNLLNRKKSKPDDIENSVKGITKALLEKYKPKGLCNIENISKKKTQSRVA